jgi:molybdopterin synthase sulfur carrier subunit
MSVPVLVSGPIKDFVKGQSRIQGQGHDVRSVLQNIDRTFPGFLEKVIPGSGARSGYSIYVSGRDMNLLAGLDTPLSESDELIIFSPMSGG